ncbi:MAG: RNA ligase family protein, partial [Candidatus Caldarchaeum sp.]
MAGIGWKEIPEYPKILPLGHKVLANLLLGPVVVQEKVDGSQFSFGVNCEGELCMRSKNQTIYPESTNELFRPAVTHVVNLYRDGAFSDLEGFIFRAETLYKPQHNTLRYDRVPKGNLMLFDVQSDGEFLSRSPDDLRDFAEWLDIECVPTECYDGADVTEQFLEEYLERASVLGGQTVEGLVIKNYDQLNPYSYHFAPLMGKHVSERFKEVHRSAWARTNPKRNDVLLRLGEELRTEARWEKAIQHMAERGD